MVACSNDYYSSSTSNLRQIYYILGKARHLDFKDIYHEATM